MEETAPNWVVYITGAVKRPGVYEVAPGSRVNDALLKAGGFSSYADPDAVNLAAHLEDGVHIRVPAKNEQERVATYSTRPAGGTPSGARDSNAAVGKSPPASRTFVVSQRDDRIDINKAIAGELTELPGIGPKLAEAIVSHREENGPFEKIEDLQSVRGIGQKRFETLRNLIKVTK
jgi:competence protein ComEA